MSGTLAAAPRLRFLRVRVTGQEDHETLPSLRHPTGNATRPARRTAAMTNRGRAS